MKLKLCTFNVNSIRARIGLILKWLKHRNNDLDVLCLQELRVVEEKFPHDVFEEFGFECGVYGEERYNGVAICSKYPLENLRKGFGVDYWDQEKRLISGKVGGISIVNVYAPHGAPRGDDKYKYKLEWYARLIEYLNKCYSSMDELIVLGDFNVARDDIDVYNPEALKDAVGTMAEERRVFEELFDWGLIDAYRLQNPNERRFTWWNYVGGMVWRDEGMRIDYILSTNPLISRLKGVEIDLWPRKRRAPKPSDHAPVIGTFELHKNL